MNGNEDKIGLLQQLKDLEQERISIQIEIDLDKDAYSRIQKSLKNVDKELNSIEALNYFNKNKEKNEQEKEALTNILLKKVIYLIARKDSIDIESAEILFNHSETYQILKSNILYNESDENIYARYKEEQMKKIVKILKNKTELLAAIEERTKETVSVLAAENIVISDEDKKMTA